jgi:hypothetical protein
MTNRKDPYAGLSLCHVERTLRLLISEITPFADLRGHVMKTVIGIGIGGTCCRT